jgi:hypothetical protein
MPAAGTSYLEYGRDEGEVRHGQPTGCFPHMPHNQQGSNFA